MSDAEEVLARLRAPGPDGPTMDLAKLAVDAFLQRPLKLRLDADLLLDVVRQVATGWDDTALESLVDGEWARLRKGYESLPGPVKDHLPADAVQTLKEQLRQPAPLDQVLVGALVDQPAIRAIMHDLLQTTLTDFVRRASSPMSDSRIVSGVVQKAKGFMKTSVTASIITAVGEGLGAEAERRVRDFVDEAVTAALGQVVARICDPRQQDAYGALRAGIFQSAVDQPARRWVAQLGALQPHQRALRVLLATRDAVQSDAFAQFFHAQVALLRPSADSLEELLQNAGLLTPVRDAAVRLLAQELHALFATDTFSTWWHALHGAAPARKGRTRRKSPDGSSG